MQEFSYREIASYDGENFLKKMRSYGDRITVSASDIWIGAFNGENDLIGVGGYKIYKDNYRIKSIFVERWSRKKWVATTIITHLFKKAEDKKITAYVVPNMKDFYLSLGFKDEKKINNNYYMVREK